MSIALTSLIWPIKIPAPEKLVLLRLADFADDDGAHIFPSLRRLADETGYEERSVRRMLRRLEGEGDDDRKPSPPKLLDLVAEADAARKRPREYRIMVPELRRLGDDAKAKRGGPGSPVTGERGGTLKTRRGDPESTGGGTLGPKRGDPGSPRSIKKNHQERTIKKEEHTPSLSLGERVDVAEPSLELVDQDGKQLPLETPRPARPRAAKRLAPALAETETAFAEFWKVYPKEEAKIDAAKAYKAALERASPAEILLGARRYAEKVVRDRTERKFIAHAATWLRADRWTDAAEPASASARGSSRGGGLAAVILGRAGRNDVTASDDGGGPLIDLTSECAR